MFRKGLYILAGFIVLLSSCQFEVPQKVQVKTSPTINASLGSHDYLISEYFGMDEILDELGDNEDISVYDFYDSESTVQKYIVHMPIMEVGLDFDDILDEELGQEIDPVEFVVPEVSFSETITTEIDINSIVSGNFTNIELLPIDIVEPGPTGGTVTLPAQDITIADFDTATFSAGNLEIYMNVPDSTEGFVISVDNLELQDTSGNTLASSTAPVNVEDGGTVMVPLAGVTLHGDMRAVLTVTSSGGTIGTPQQIESTVSMTGIQVSSATGLNFTESVSIPATNIPVDAGGTFIEAVIGSGSISMDIAALPAAWTGFTRTTSLDMTQTGGLSLSATNDPSSPLILDLAGKTLNNSDIAVNGNFSLVATDASVSGLDGNPVSITTTVTTEITNFAKLTISAPADLVQTTEYSEPVPQDMKDWVQSVTFDEAGINLTLSNTMPVGVSNDMTVRVNSTAFGITNVENTYTAGSTDQTGTFTNTNFTFTTADHVNMDFSVTIIPAGYNEGAGTLTLNNISPGAEPISFSGNVEVIADWSEAVVNADALDPISGSFPEATEDPIDLSEIEEYFGTDLLLGDIPLYFYLSGLENTSGITLGGSITADYTSGSNTILASGDPVKFVDIIPDFSSVSEEDHIYSGSLPKPSFIAEEESYSYNLSTIFNDRPSDLVLDYSLQPTGTATIYNNEENNFPPIKAEIVMVLPLQLVTTADPAEIIFDELSSEGEDLFEREPGEENEDLDRIFESLEKITLTMSYNNSTGFAGNIFLRQTGWESDHLTFQAGSNTLNFVLDKTEDVQFIRDTKIFAPDIILEVPGTGISIQRGGSLNIRSLKASAVFDVDQTFEF